MMENVTEEGVVEAQPHDGKLEEEEEVQEIHDDTNSSVIIALNNDSTVNLNPQLTDQVVSIKILDIQESSSSPQSPQSPQTTTTVEASTEMIGNDIEGGNCNTNVHRRSGDDLTEKSFGHFRKIGSDKALCLMCNTLLSYRSGSTSVMMRHLKKIHPDMDTQNLITIEEDEEDDDEDNGGGGGVVVVQEKGDDDGGGGKIRQNVDSSGGGNRENDQERTTTVVIIGDNNFMDDDDDDDDDDDGDNDNDNNDGNGGEVVDDQEIEEVVHLPSIPSQRKDVSKAWKFFDKVTVENSEVVVVECKLCFKRYATKNGSTSTMLRHMRQAHKDVDIENDHVVVSTTGDTTEHLLLNQLVEHEQHQEQHDDLKKEVIVTTQGETHQIIALVQDEKKRSLDEPDEDDDGVVVFPNKRQKTEQKSAKKEPRSLAWTFFDKIGDDDQVRCRLCDKRYHTRGGSTTVMHRHLKKEHPNDLSNTKPRRENEEGKQRSFVETYFQRILNHSDVFSCKLCNKKYSRKDRGSMLRHLRRDHKEEYKSAKSSNEFDDILGDDDDDEEGEEGGGGGNGDGGEEEAEEEEEEEEEQEQEEEQGHHDDNEEVVVEANVQRTGEPRINDEIDSAVIPPPKKSTRKSQNSRSSVWSFFSKNPDGSVKCKICQRSYSNVGGSTSAMLRHLRKSHPNRTIDDLPTMTTTTTTTMKSSQIESARGGESSDNEVFAVVVKNNVLPIICKPGSKKTQKLSQSENILLEGFALERDECLHSDVTIVCQNGLAIKTHKLILASLSLLMYEILKDQPPGEDSVILAPDISYDTLSSFIDKLYKGGDISLNEMVEVVCDFGFKMEKINYPTDGHYYHHHRRRRHRCCCQDHEQEQSLLENSIESKRKMDEDHNFIAHSPPPPNTLPFENSSPDIYYFGDRPKENVNPSTSTISIDVDENPGNDGKNSAEKEIKTERDEKLFTAAKRKSAIWNFFTKNKAIDYSTCHSCLKNVSCKQHSTSSMIKHLQRHHKNLYEKFISPTTSMMMMTTTSSSSSSTAMMTSTTTATTTTTSQQQHLSLSKISDATSKRSRFKDPNERTCQVCLKVFSTRNKMTLHHNAVHLGIKAYTCDVCGKSYSRVDTLKDHVTSAHSVDGPTFLCKFCGKVFKRRATRFRHERFHRNDRRHQCSFCPKKFFTNQTLRNHERTHTGEKPFRCHQCSRCFAMMHQLTTHMRVHTGDKPYRCNYCKETFKYSSSKNKHYCTNMPTEQKTLVVTNRSKKRIIHPQTIVHQTAITNTANTTGGEIEQDEEQGRTTGETFHAVVTSGEITEVEEVQRISASSDEESY